MAPALHKGAHICYHILPTLGYHVTMIIISRFGYGWKDQHETSMLCPSVHVQHVPWKAPAESVSNEELIGSPSRVAHVVY